MDKLNILVLHSLGNPALAPAFLSNHVFALQRNFPNHNYLYHDTALNLPDYVIDQDFDAIILDVTFLTARWVSPDFLTVRKRIYEFVKDSSAVKIAFPQDEYDCNELLDEWMCEWNVDVVFSVISSNWHVLYPRYHKIGHIRLGYTAYIDESLISRQSKCFSSRTIDIGYRARKLPPYFGKIGEVKWTIGRDVANFGKLYDLNMDIIVGDQGTLFGQHWYNFISNCKFTLGSNSGSSLLDPRGEIQRCVKSYLAINPSASFEEVEELFFKGKDGRYSLTAISPRIIEASLLNSAQILVEGSYSNVIQPYEHFIPIREDASNFQDVYNLMLDITFVKRMIKNCREAILSVDALRYSNNARSILELIAEVGEKKGTRSNTRKIDLIISRYMREMGPKYKLLWLKNKCRRSLIRLLSPYPLLYNPLKNFVTRPR